MIRGRRIVIHGGSRLARAFLRLSLQALSQVALKSLCSCCLPVVGLNMVDDDDDRTLVQSMCAC